MAPRRTFTVKEKVDIISRLENGENNVDLCKQFGVSHSTISTMWKNRAKIMQCFESKSLKIKKNRNPTHQDIENVLLVWFKAQRSQNVPISGPLLQEKANHFARQLGKTDFKCSESWIYRFRQRHDIVVGKVCGEAAGVSQNDCDNWLRTVLPKLTEGYTDSQIWNADETGLFFKLTPDRTLKFKGEKCTGGKLSKDRITVLVASSMEGEKRKLLVIGKAKKPRCFKNVKTLPVDYEANKKAWMTSEIFEKVLRKWDSELRRHNKKIILFIDNCPAHPHIQKLTNIKLAFLPPNTTSVIQPIDQGIIKTLKSHYRKLLVEKMVNDNENSSTPFAVNILDGIEMLTTAWARVTADTIKKCFSHAGFGKFSTINTNDEDSDDEMDNLPLARLSSAEPTVTDWETYVNIDDQVITTDNLTDNEIIESVLQTQEQEHEDEEHEEEDCNVNEIPTIRDALCAITTLKKYCLFGEASNNLDVEGIMKMEYTLQRAQKSKLKQCTITRFFNKSLV
ncbi:unnamed protein product [Danaus chrysippus]|uniref:(African queen) hypothetical protein n=1 Tax=Danaus chrysippus TaxID=151541 RepID=A0A8J2QU52_9NEOP|nr:unnamed protein product [Danaus chrysippus]